MQREQHTRDVTEGSAETPRSTRRHLLRLAGAAATGAAASTLLATQASADNGLTVATAGATLSDEFTKVTYSGTAIDGHLFLFRSGASAADTAGSSARAVLAGASDQTALHGVVGFHSGSGTGVGGTSSSGIGMLGRSLSGDGAAATTISGNCLLLSVVSSDGNHLRFGSFIANATPADRAGKATSAGTLSVFADGTLWYCVEGGTPGLWRKVVGASTAGSFHPIATARVYDSRKTMTPMANGILATGASRVIDVSDKRDTSTGAVTLADAVPDHATAVAYNLTILGTVGTNGFLSVEPGDASAAGGSAINWSAAGLTLANASVAKLDGSRQLKVFCGGSSTSCHFIIDIVGYYL